MPENKKNTGSPSLSPPANSQRAAFFQRVRESLGRTPGEPTPIPAPLARDESLIRQVASSDSNRIERFIERAKSGSMVVSRISSDPTLVRSAIDAAFSQHAIKSCVLNARDLESQFALPAHLASHGIATIPWGSPNCRDAAFLADASITDARGGLADAGSLLVWSDPTFGRSPTLVVPVHLVLLPASRILPDLIDGLAFVARETGGQLPSNVLLINGPSKTRDIEMNLVTGVHGPKHVYVLVIDGL